MATMANGSVSPATGPILTSYDVSWMTLYKDSLNGFDLSNNMVARCMAYHCKYCIALKSSESRNGH